MNALQRARAAVHTRDMRLLAARAQRLHSTPLPGRCYLHSSSALLADVGRVREVLGESIVVEGIPNVGVFSLVAFSSGGAGIVSALGRDGSVHVVPLLGSPAAHDRAVVAARSLTLRGREALLGRAINPL